LSCDALGTAAGLNLYLYVNDSPVVLIDPTGNEPENCGFPVNDDFKYKIGAFQCVPRPRKKNTKNKAKKAGSSGGGEGRKDGVEGGVGSRKSRATKFATAKVIEEGAGDGQGGLSDPEEAGEGTDVGNSGGSDAGIQSGSGTGNERRSGTSRENKPGDGTKKESGSGQEGPSGSGSGKQGEEIDPVTGIASLIIDPESLAEGKQSGKSGGGSPAGSRFGFIKGWLAKALTWLLAFGSWAGNLLKKAFSKLKGALGKAREALGELRDAIFRKRLPEKRVLQLPNDETRTAFIGNNVVKWGNGKDTAKTIGRTAEIEEGGEKVVQEMIDQGLTKEWVQSQLDLYRKAIANPAKQANEQLLPRAELMETILSLWPK
jgi:hypothetical protein